MTVEEYIYFRTGSKHIPVIIRNMFVKPFFSDSLRAFWHYWNPGYGYFLLFYCYKPLLRILPHWASVVVTFAICGFFHDILYIFPIILLDGFGFIYPLVTVWFVFIALGILLTEALKIRFARIPKWLRAFFHIGFLLLTFYLARCLDINIA